MTNAGPFTTPQIAAMLGVPLRKILSFIERRYFAPSVQEASGHGTKRLWSYDDLIRCAVVTFLDHALAASSIRDLSPYLQVEELIQPWNVWHIGVRHRVAWVVTPTKEQAMATMSSAPTLSAGNLALWVVDKKGGNERIVRRPDVRYVGESGNMAEALARCPVHITINFALFHDAAKMRISAR